MVLEDLADSPYAIRFADLPPHVADAFRWAFYRDSLRDAGTPEDQIPAFEEWKAARNG